jgi:hypothetical protein
MKAFTLLFVQLLMAVSVSAQDRITGYLVAVESRIFPLGYYVIVVQDESFNIKEYKISDQIKIGSQPLFTKTVSSFFDQTLEKGDEPDDYYDARFLGRKYTFSLQKTDSDIRECILLSESLSNESAQRSNYTAITHHNWLFYKPRTPLFESSKICAFTREIEILNNRSVHSTSSLKSDIFSTLHLRENMISAYEADWSQMADSAKLLLNLIVSDVFSEDKIIKLPFIQNPVYNSIVKINANLIITYGTQAKTKTFTVSGRGAVNGDKYDQNAAYQRAIKSLEKQIAIKVNELYPPYTKIFSVLEEKKGQIKSLTLQHVENALDSNLKYSVSVFTPSEYKMNGEEIVFDKPIAKGKIKSVRKFSGEVDVILTEGHQNVKYCIEKSIRLYFVFFPQ